MKKHKPYELVRVNSGNLYTEAAYCKHYPNMVYAALFEEYPAQLTKVTLIRKVGENDHTNYGVRLCNLISHQADGSENIIGQYVPVCTVQTEKEATEAMENNLRSLAAVAELFGGTAE